MAEEMGGATVGEPAGGIGEITDEDKLWSLLSWLFWPIAIVVLLMEDKKSRPFIKYNAVQALALGLIAWATTLVAIGVCLGPLAWIYSIFLGIKAYQGETVEVPFITGLCQGQGWI
jgi:uncharacterized membrane protein